MTEVKKKAQVPNKEKHSKAAVADSTSRKRPVRITRDLLVNKGPLVVPESAKRSGMVNFWMKDEAYKFEKYQRLGFDFATDSQGQKVSVGRQGEKMFLLEIPQDLHDQIKAIKHDLRLEKTAERTGIQNPRDRSDPERMFEEKLDVK